MPARPHLLVEVYAAALELSCGEKRQFLVEKFHRKMLLEILELEFCPGRDIEDRRREQDRR